MRDENFEWGCADRGLADELGCAIGWSHSDGISELVRAVARWVPAGTTAKLRTVLAGDTPPGSDPDAVARRVLAGRTSLASESGADAWSCWPLVTLVALLAAGAGVPAMVVAARNRGATVPVDLHGALLLGSGAEQVIADPYFGLCLPGPGAAECAAVVPGTFGLRQDHGDGRWSYRLLCGRWVQPLVFSSFGVGLDRADVAMMCRLSATHSGASPRPLFRLTLGDGVVNAAESADGSVTCTQWWHPPDRDGLTPFYGTCDKTVVPTWDVAVEWFRARTDVAIAHPYR